MSARPRVPAVPRSLVLATDLDVLPTDRVVTQRDDYLVIRSPSNPAHYWGNFLLFGDAPRTGDGVRWERLFEAEFGDQPRIRHRVFAWDRVDGELGAAREEFVAHGYRLEECVGLTATASEVRPHPRANTGVRVRSLDPRAGVEDALWDEVVELQVAGRDDSFEEVSHREFSRRRLDDLRALFQAGRGAWYVALGDTGEVLASCGVVVTNTRGRFQAVDTKAEFRRQGICSRLVVDAAHDAARQYGAQRLVIAADANYHALGLYESLGFAPTERVVGVCRRPATV